MELVIAIVLGLALGAVGYAVGRSGGRSAGVDEGRSAGLEEARRASEAGLRSLVESVKRGRAPEGVSAGSIAAELMAALEQGWSPKEAEREAALREAVGRVSTFLDTRVRTPLDGAGEGEGAAELRERIHRALGALEDLDFFLSEANEIREGSNLATLVQKVSREFAADQDVGVRLMLGSAIVNASVGPSALMDALYLVLHNAARFGEGGTIDLSVDQADGRARIVIRDRGQGFTEEAFQRAFDPFYSTSDEGLGLGLPHARKVVEGMGGRIELRNVPDGGAEVEMSFPAA
jgi:signal transduction histidine kinase